MKIVLLIIFHAFSIIQSQVVETYGNFDIKFFTDSECMELVDELLYEAHNFCQLFNGINIIKQNKFEGYSNALSLELYKIKDESECYDENNKVECFYCAGPKEQESEEGIDATSDEETEDTDNEILPVTLLCNGVCLKAFWMNKMDSTLPTYYYTCVYNNIHPNLQFRIKRYNGKKNCDDSHLIAENTYNGSDLCWIDDRENNWSLMPVQWIDDKKKLIYSTMNKANCTGGNINITQSYAICNGKCFNNETDKDYSYTCKKTSSSYISYKKIIIVFLMMILY